MANNADIPAILSLGAQIPLMTREQLVAHVHRNRLPADAIIPHPRVFSLNRDDFIDPRNGTFHEALYNNIKKDLDYLQTTAYGQQLFRDILSNKNIAEPIAIRTEFSRRSPLETSPMDSVAQYLKPPYNELVFNTDHMANFATGPLRHWGFQYPIMAIAHEGDHAAFAQAVPFIGAIPAPIIVSLYERLAMKREVPVRADLNAKGLGPLRRDRYFEFGPYVNTLIDSTPLPILKEFVEQTGSGPRNKEGVFNLLMHMSLLNDGYLAIENVMGEKGAEAFLKPGAQSPFALGSTDSRFQAEIERTMSAAHGQAEKWLNELMTRAKDAYAKRATLDTQPQKRGDLDLPTMPKLNVAAADTGSIEGSNALPAHLRNQTSRAIV